MSLRCTPAFEPHKNVLKHALKRTIMVFVTLCTGLGFAHLTPNPYLSAMLTSATITKHTEAKFWCWNILYLGTILPNSSPPFPAHQSAQYLSSNVASIKEEEIQTNNALPQDSLHTITCLLASEGLIHQRQLESSLDTISAVVISQRHISSPPPCNLIKVISSLYLVCIWAVSLDSACTRKPSFTLSF
jgi:hypothetical protein